MKTDKDKIKEEVYYEVGEFFLSERLKNGKLYDYNTAMIREGVRKAISLTYEKTRQETADEMEILLHNKIVELRVKLTKLQKVDSDIVDSELYNLDYWFGEELKKKFVPDSLKPQRGFKEDKNG